MGDRRLGALSVSFAAPCVKVDEKKAYISSVQCLARLPPEISKAVCPGCRNRYDDFVVVHIQQSFSIHVTGNFLTWHRSFTWSYEQTLRNECGYRGSQPYYSYSRWTKDPTKSPLLDGSDTSISGQGAPGCKNQTLTGIPLNTQPLIKIPHGPGGGCVTTEPFKDCTDHQSFWSSLQGGATDSFMNFIGVHTYGHFVIGGDPGGDFMSSPGHPFFFFHYASIDRLYWIWQNLEPAERTKALYGPTFISDFTSPAASLQDKPTMGTAYPGDITIEDASSTMAGPFCYIYV
ncbi:Di-copper centre-containing protein [Didymella exigua CBS 183.55]|uniref:Di-copper centre-containing protein n=1 Tax=Didymella exigua CBS 183.55 TaxID=1150837 RepID=A0A6A5RZS6_9PLEO|nr:Di-copper centre-containing protein [Didymella exigua CBS 183.55]KAF1933362.1 Di-copper centre-containing protein [Didymella exigua CBS 183.55]